MLNNSSFITLNTRTHQKGIALISVLMITLIIMALSVSLAINVFREHRLSRNAADLAIARQAAEAALRDAEHDIACEVWDTATNKFIPNTIANYRCPLELGKQSFIPTACKDGWINAPISNTDTNPRLSTTYFSGSSPCYRTFGQTTKQPSFNILGINSNHLQPNQPRYFIEVFNKSNGGKVGITNYRITARGYGRNPNTMVDLQSLFRPVAQ